MAVGPVDVYIIGFPGNKFSGRIAPAIMELVENGTIRVIDLLFLSKDADGVVTTLEAADIDEDGAAYLSIDVTQPGALGQEDAEEVSDDLPANSSALLIAFENLWTAKVVDALQAADAVMIDSIRIPVDVAEAVSTRARPVHFEIERMRHGTSSNGRSHCRCRGTATAVSGRVQRRQAPEYDQQDQQAYEQQHTTSSSSTRSSRPPPQQARRRGGRSDRAAREVREAARAGRTHRRGVCRRQGQDPRNLIGRARSVRHVEAYSRLAGVYDEIVVDPCYGDWASFLDALWSAEPAPVRSVLDVCCGTGLLAHELVARGYRVVGVDASEAMLDCRTRASRSRGGGAPHGAPRTDGRGRLRRGGLHVRRPQLPRARGVTADDGRGRHPSQARWLVRLRPAHGPDDAVHAVESRRCG